MAPQTATPPGPSTQPSTKTLSTPRINARQLAQGSSHFTDRNVRLKEGGWSEALGSAGGPGQSGLLGNDLFPIAPLTVPPSHVRIV